MCRGTHTLLTLLLCPWVSRLRNNKHTSNSPHKEGPVLHTHGLIFCIFSCLLFLESAPWKAALGERQGPFTCKPTNPGRAPSHLHSLVLSPGQGPSVLITARPGPRQPAAAAEPCVYSDQPVRSLLALPRLTLPMETTTKTSPSLPLPDWPHGPPWHTMPPVPRHLLLPLQSFLCIPVFPSLIKTNAGTSWIRYQVMNEVTLVTLKSGTEGLPWQSSG